MIVINYIILFLTSCWLFGAETSSNGPNYTGFNYIVKNNSNASIKFSNPDYTFDLIQSENNSLYKKPVFSYSSHTSSSGSPDLPSRTTFIAVDPQKNYTIEI